MVENEIFYQRKGHKRRRKNLNKIFCVVLENIFIAQLQSRKHKTKMCINKDAVKNLDFLLSQANVQI